MSKRRHYLPSLERLDGRRLPSATPLTPGQIEQAYGINSVSIAGAGQTIAIVDAFNDPFLASDVATFDRLFNLPGQTTAQLASTLSVVNLAGNQTNAGWAEEEALDVEWAHAIASGAKIIVVEAASDSLSDLMNAVNVARNIPGVSVVSMSWGSNEFFGETAYDSFFATPAGHTPITFVAATGDQGAWSGADWPASSPNVVAVGGTTLSVSSSGAIQFESGWSGSGGGVSRFESEPTYQMSVQLSGRRTTPDVSLDADPNSGLYTYFTSPASGQGTWEVVGGTSASTQIWGGILAVADEVRAIFGKGTLNTASTLSALYATPAAFNDITSGFNGFTAGPGYDLVTGLGSPRSFPVYVALYQPGTLTTATATVAHATTSTTGKTGAAAMTTDATIAAIPSPTAPDNTLTVLTPATPTLATNPPSAESVVNPLHTQSQVPLPRANIGTPGLLGETNNELSWTVGPNVLAVRSSGGTFGALTSLALGHLPGGLAAVGSQGLPDRKGVEIRGVASRPVRLELETGVDFRHVEPTMLDDFTPDVGGALDLDSSAVSYVDLAILALAATACEYGVQRWLSAPHGPRPMFRPEWKQARLSSIAHARL